MQIYADFLCIFIDNCLPHLLTGESVGAVTSEDEDLAVAEDFLISAFFQTPINRKREFSICHPI